MKKELLKICLLFAFITCGNMAYAQLPNEKFGKPSNLEWEYKGWGDAIDADAIILCKTMKVTYELTDQFGNKALMDGYVFADGTKRGRGGSFPLLRGSTACRLRTGRSTG